MVVSLSWETLAPRKNAVKTISVLLTKGIRTEDDDVMDLVVGNNDRFQGTAAFDEGGV